MRTTFTVKHFSPFVLLLLWFQFRRSKPAKIAPINQKALTEYVDALNEISAELAKTKSGFIQDLLVGTINEQKETAEVLQTIGLVVASFEKLDKLSKE